MSPRTDVYSLGCVLFEALTGTAPYKRENDLATLWAHVYAPPPSVREVVARYTAAVRRRRAAARWPRILRSATRPQASSVARRSPRRARRGGSCSRAPRRSSSASDDRPPHEPPGDRWTRRPAARGRGGRRLLLLAAAVAGGRGALRDRTSRRPTAPHRRPSPPLRAASAWRPPARRCRHARQNMVGTVLDGTIWVVGGLESRSDGSRRVEGYDPVINGWKSAPDLPVRLHHEMVVTYKDEVVVIGGWIPEGIRSQRRGLRPGVRAARREVGGACRPCNRPRAAGAAAVVGDQIVVVGGQADGRLRRHHRGVRRQAVERRGRTSRRRASTWRRPRTGSSSTRWAGGALSPDKNSPALERYDPATDSWQRLPDMPTARGGLGAAIADGHLFAVGGESPTDAFGDGRSPTTSRARRGPRAPSMRTPRHGIAVAAIGRSLYALGGATATRPRQRIGDRRGPQTRTLNGPTR